MEENDIPSTSERRVLHLFSNTLSRHRMPFYADLSSSESHSEKKRRISIGPFFSNILNYPKSKRRIKQMKKPRSICEHTNFDKYSTKTTCPNCLYYIETNIKRHNTYITHLIAVTLLPICMCALPYYSTNFKDTVHSCPRCKIYLGTKFAKGTNFITRLIANKEN